MVIGSIIYLPESERTKLLIFGARALDYLIANCEGCAFLTDSHELYHILEASGKNNVYQIEENASEEQLFASVCEAAAGVAKARRMLAEEIAEHPSLCFGIRYFVVCSESNDPMLKVLRYDNPIPAEIPELSESLLDMLYAVNSTGYAVEMFQNINPAELTHKMHMAILERYMRNNVRFIDPNNTYVDVLVEIGRGCTIYPNVYLEGDTKIGENTEIMPGCRLVDTKVGNNCKLQYVVANKTVICDNVTVGPFVNLRPDTVISNNCKIGDFVEVKNSNIGEGTKLPHLSYIGDSDIGERVNVGCGTVFVNYDGLHKHRSVVGNDVFIGCNANLIAPITVKNGAYIAAGSTITDDVPEETLAIARARQQNKPDWVPPAKRTK